MKEFIKSTVLGCGQFDIEVLDTKTGRQFKLPAITGIFFNNKIDKETFCYTPVQSGSSQEGDRVDDCGYNVVFNIVTFLNKILSGEINETNFYETAEKIARQIDPSWKWRKQELGALRYSRIRTSGNSVTKNSLNKNFNRIYIFGSKINILFQASRNSSFKISVPEFPDTLHRPV